MRVIAGKAKRLQLKTIDTLSTRPTTDRIKETLFNMINPYLYESEFLDLYAGSGAIGIEALSRGCKESVFIESNKEAVRCIKENLRTTKLDDQATVLSVDVLQGLHDLENKKIFDIIFMDPPYHQEFEKQVLNYLEGSSLITKDTMIIVEAAIDTEIEYIENTKFKITKIKEYKTNMHIFLEMKE